MKLYKRFRTLVLLGAMLLPASTSLAAEARPLAPVVARQTDSPAQNYAAREKAGPAKVATFQGGGTGVYIGGSTLVVVLLVVIIVLLI